MLEVKGVTRRFGEIVAVDQVSFTVPGGTMTGFVGSNGAGKTTTMRMIMGVLGIDQGEVRWQGHAITAADRRTFGYMPEERGLYPKQRILDQLTYLGQLKGMSQAAARTEAMSYLERFGLGERAKDRVQQLSLGNQQRVQIVASLLNQPRALILDEPFSGLDPKAVDAMAEVLRDHTRRGVPVLFSSHQLDLVDRLCDGLVILASGKVVASGTSDQLRTSGPVRYRLVTGPDTGWLSGIPGVSVVARDAEAVTFEVLQPGAEQVVLRDALARGPVLDFARVRPALSEIYREVAA